MNIILSPIDENYIKSKVEAGYYSNFTEGVRDAVRKMRESDEQRAELMAAIQVGEQQVAEGRIKPYNAELRDKIKQNARARAVRGEKPSADVLP